jgi:hypothetical protein
VWRLASPPNGRTSSRWNHTVAEWPWPCGLGWTGSGLNSLVDFCEDCDEPSCSERILSSWLVSYRPLPFACVQPYTEWAANRGQGHPVIAGGCTSGKFITPNLWRHWSVSRHKPKRFLCRETAGAVHDAGRRWPLFENSCNSILSSAKTKEKSHLRGRYVLEISIIQWNRINMSDGMKGKFKHLVRSSRNLFHENRIRFVSFCDLIMWKPLGPHCYAMRIIALCGFPAHRKSERCMKAKQWNGYSVPLLLLIRQHRG